MKRRSNHFRRLSCVCAVSVMALTVAASGAMAEADTTQFDIDAQPLPRAILEFSKQSNIDVIVPSELVRGKQSAPIAGDMPADEALTKMLEGSGLKVSVGDDGSLRIVEAALRPTAATTRMADARGATTDSSNEDVQANGSDDADVKTLEELRDRTAIEEEEEETKEERGLLDQVIVEGSRNVGVRRFEDDAQPYVVYNADDIRSSMSFNLEDFFRTRLPQNTTQGSNQQFTSLEGSLGNTSSINLRGLGANQTLILVNGRRAPRVSFSAAGSDFQQADINGIPMASIERIEVLPATASGIYGGGATGGVINIITRRDFQGGEIQLRYGNTFDTSFAEYGVDGSYGFALEDGRTHVTLSASYSNSGTLLARERPFGERSFALALENAPEEVFGQFIPPTGATPNIRSTFGNLILDDGTDLGSDITFVPTGYAGVGSDGGQGLVDNAGQYNFEPSPDILGELLPIRQSPEVYGGTVSVRREFTERLELFVDASFSRNKAQRRTQTLPGLVFLPGPVPGNPFQGSVLVSYPSIGPTFDSDSTQETLQVVGGANYELPGNWLISADFNWSRARTESISTSPGFDVPFRLDPAIRAGTVELLRDPNAFPLDLSPFAVVSPNQIVGPRDTILRNGAIRASGPAFDLPAGPVNISALLETRDEILKAWYEDSYDFFSGVPGELNTEFTPERSQHTDSVYLEALIPLFSDNNAIPMVKALDLQVSGRYDRFVTESPDADDTITVASRDVVPDPVDTLTNKFDSIDFTVGLRYEVSEDLLLRASYGTGFLPPSVRQIFPDEFMPGFVPASDPKRGGESPGLVDTVKFAGNPDLRPEQSESWSFGAILTPRAIPGFRFSIDYSVTDKTDEIIAPVNQEILDREDMFPDRVGRAPLTPEDMAAGFTGGRITFFDRSAVNFASTRSASLDFQLDQVIETDDYGMFRFYALATHLLELSSQLTPDSEVVDMVGFNFTPLAWRGNAGLTWDSPDGAWSLGWNAQYYDSYFVFGPTSGQGTIDLQTRLHGREKIPSEIYNDFFAVYRPSASTGNLAGLLENLEIRFGIQNAFNKIPATRPGLSPTAGAFSAYGDNRLRRFTIQVRKGI